jgi:hypothetical protein
LGVCPSLKLCPSRGRTPEFHHEGHEEHENDSRRDAEDDEIGYLLNSGEETMKAGIS